MSSSVSIIAPVLSLKFVHGAPSGQYIYLFLFKKLDYNKPGGELRKTNTYYPLQ